MSARDADDADAPAHARPHAHAGPAEREHAHGSAAVREHRAHAPSPGRVGVAVLTVSDSRKPANDASGALAREALAAAGFDVPWQRLVRDEAEDVRAALADALAADAVDAFVATGGTGAAPRDVTVEAVRPLFEKELPGFGELFRLLSYQEVGSAAMMSRATAGIVGGKPVFLLPGSPDAVSLALERLVVPELPHLVGVARGRRG